jgi:hypothetical protein
MNISEGACIGAFQTSRRLPHTAVRIPNLREKVVCAALCVLSSSVFAQMAPVTPMERSVLTDGLKGRVELPDRLPKKDHEIRDSFLIDVITSPSFKPLGNRLALLNAVIVHDIHNTSPKPQSLVVPLELQIVGSDFETTFICRSCHFREDLSLIQDQFSEGIELEGSDIAGGLQVYGGTAKPIPSAAPPDAAIDIRNLHVGGAVLIGFDNVDGYIDASYLKAASLHTGEMLHLWRLELSHAEVGDLSIDVQRDDYPISLSMTGLTAGAIDLYLPAVASYVILDSIRAENVIIESANPPTQSQSNSSQKLPNTPEGALATLEGATIRGDLSVFDTRVDSLRARSASIAGRVLLSDVTVANSISLEDATLGSLSWSARVFPAKVSFDDIRCSHWSISRLPSTPDSGSQAGGAPSQGSDVTLDVLKSAQFSQAAFASYETDLKARGATSRAEEAYFAMRVKGRDVNAHEGHWTAVILDCIQQYFLGYGRSARAPLIWSGIFVLVGFFTFRKANEMEPRVERPGAYSGFWYSLELFLPIVDLGVAKEWRPKATSGLRIVYARFHELVGWILVPVAIAAITGITR